MSLEAFLDFNKTCLISAEDAFYKFGKETHSYFCPNKNCSAKMTLKSYDGKKKHYFAALEKFPHIENCRFKVKNFKFEDFNESNFSIEKIFNRISQSENEIKININTNIKDKNNNTSEEKVLDTIKTLNQLYFMCLSLDVNDKYNDIKIWKILLDDRSESFYVNGIYNGIRLIKCKYKRYNREEKKIYLKTYGDFDVAIYIKSDTLFKNIKDLMFNNSKLNKLEYVILGNWEKQGKYMVAEVNSEKQYKMLG